MDGSQCVSETGFALQFLRVCLIGLHGGDR